MSSDTFHWPLMWRHLFDTASRWIPVRRLRAFYLEEQARYLRFLVPPGQTVLEIGCREGEILSRLRPARGIGLDRSERLVAFARERFPELAFEVWKPGPLTIEGQFDVIILRHVVGMMDDIQADLLQLRRNCHPETRLIVINHNFLWAPFLILAERTGLKRSTGVTTWLSLNDLRSLLVLSGFDVVRSEYRTLVPFATGISWLPNRVLGKLPGIWKLGIDQWTVARPLGLRQQSVAPSVSVIVPCRNERGTIEAIARRVPALGRHTELIFVEGHSTDGTPDELFAVRDRHPGLDMKILVQEGKGKGDAVRCGMDAATGDVVVILDADISVDPEALPRFVAALTEEYCELAIGSRLVYPRGGQSMRILNALANKIFARAFSFLIGQRIKDTLCGTKALWRSQYRRMALHRDYFGRADPFGDFDLVFGAARLSYRILEIPVRYRERVYGRTNIRRWRHGLALARMVAFGFVRMKLQ